MRLMPANNKNNPASTATFRIPFAYNNGSEGALLPNFMSARYLVREIFPGNQWLQENGG